MACHSHAYSALRPSKIGEQFCIYESTMQVIDDFFVEVLDRSSRDAHPYDVPTSLALTN